jgi:hypothetical protein
VPDPSAWLKLHDAILAVYREEHRSMSYVELYKYAQAQAAHPTLVSHRGRPAHTHTHTYT